MSNGGSIDPTTGQQNIGDEGGDGDVVFRISHIHRVYQNDDPDTEIWVDIERIDELQRQTTYAGDGQLSHWTFDWSLFDPDNAPKKRITEPKNDSNYIDVPLRDTYFVRSTINGQASLYRFINDETNKARDTHSRRIYHHEIKEAYLQDGLPPSDPQDYFNSLGKQDKDSYVDVEVIDRVWSKHKALRDIHGQRIKTFTGLIQAIHEYAQKKKWVSADTDRLLREPLLDDDETDPNFMPIYNPDAGPEIDPPWRLDPIQNIVNVSWGAGAVFVWGTLTDDALYYARFNSKGSSPERKTLSLPAHGDPKNGFSAYGSSYHLVVKGKGTENETRKPVFVFCGNGASVADASDDVGNPVHVTTFHTRVFYSNDGLSWQIGYSNTGTPTFDDPANNQANTVALVWDKDDESFYYDQNIVLTDQIYSSKDGTGFSMAGSQGTGGDTGYRSPFEYKHCKGNDCFDELGQHVPDGVMVFDKNKNVTLRPKKPPVINYAQGLSSVGFASGDPQETWGSSEVEIVTETENGKETKTVSITGLKKVFCVAGANGIYMAGGSPDLAGDTGAVVLSVDDGKTWDVLDTFASSVTTMVAASGSDIPKSTQGAK
jgi:hypothetical protein